MLKFSLKENVPLVVVAILSAIALGGAVTATLQQGANVDAIDGHPITTTTAAVEKITRRVCADAYNADLGAPQRSSELEVCAQLRAADAAEITSTFALMQIILSVLGFLAVLVTLWVTGRAAHHASVQARAAIRSNHTTLLVGQNQTRAYISLGRLQATPTGPKPFVFEIFNTGQTPARACRYEYLLSMHDEGEEGGFIIASMQPDEPNYAELPRSEKPVPVGVFEHQASRLRQKLQSISRLEPAIFTLVVRYQDVFGRYFELIEKVVATGVHSAHELEGELNIMYVDSSEREISAARHGQVLDSGSFHDLAALKASRDTFAMPKVSD